MVKYHYLLISEKIAIEAEQIKVKVVPSVDITSNHDYLELNLYRSKTNKSRDERRKFGRYPELDE